MAGCQSLLLFWLLPAYSRDRGNYCAVTLNVRAGRRLRSARSYEPEDPRKYDNQQESKTNNPLFRFMDFSQHIHEYQLSGTAGFAGADIAALS